MNYWMVTKQQINKKEVSIISPDCHWHLYMPREGGKSLHKIKIGIKIEE
jgi:hypothetical protein